MGKTTRAQGTRCLARTRALAGFFCGSGPRSLPSCVSANPAGILRWHGIGLLFAHSMWPVNALGLLKRSRPWHALRISISSAPSLPGQQGQGPAVLGMGVLFVRRERLDADCDNVVS